MKFRHILILILLLSASTKAHHSVSASFDQSRSVTMEMEVAEFHFVNPHPYIDARQLADTENLWSLEMDNRRELIPLGFSADTLRPGDIILVTTNPGIYNANIAYVIAIEHRRLGFRYEANVRQLINLD